MYSDDEYLLNVPSLFHVLYLTFSFCMYRNVEGITGKDAQLIQMMTE